MNIVWRKPDGGVALTVPTAGADPEAHAAALKAAGRVPADWEAVAFDAPVPDAPLEALAWENGALAVDDAYEPPPRWIAKTAIYRRMTDAELVLLDEALPGIPLRSRLMWQDAEGGLVSVAEVEPLFAAAVGAERAAELLAP